MREDALVEAMALEDIDESDVDLADCDNWDELDWERAYCSGFLERSGFYEQEESGQGGSKGRVRTV